MTRAKIFPDAFECESGNLLLHSSFTCCGFFKIAEFLWSRVRDSLQIYVEVSSQTSVNLAFLFSLRVLSSCLAQQKRARFTEVGD